MSAKVAINLVHETVGLGKVQYYITDVSWEHKRVALVVVLWIRYLQ